MDNHNNFLFFDLQQLTPGKPFPGFAPGSFVDMFGREIELKAKDLQTFITNTIGMIKEYKDKGMPGLPIDARKHDKGDAAGWIVGVETSEVNDSNGTAVPVISILAEWTKLGTELISEKIQTNFSPTVDLEGKVIVGGSLTNWPASVDDNGVPLFTAVELAQGIHYLETATGDTDHHKGGFAASPPVIAIDENSNDESFVQRVADLVAGVLRQRQEQKPNKLEDKQAGDSLPNNNVGDEPMTIELTQEQLDELVNNRVNDALAELETSRQNDDPKQVNLSQLAEAFGLNTDAAQADGIKHLDQLAELVQQQAELQWQQKLARMQRENRYAELAARVVGGSPDAPRGIPANADKIKSELMLLEPERAKFWASVLEDTVKHGLTDYSELGHGRKTKQRRQVPDHAVSSLRATLDAGNDPQEFFEMAGLGNADDYDLSPFVKEEK